MAEGDWPTEPDAGREDDIPRGWRIAGLAAAVIAFLLVAAAILVSTFDVAYGTRVYGQKTLYAGRRGALRVAVLNLADLDFARQVRAEVRLVGPHRVVALGEGSAGPTRAVELNFRLPDDLEPGPYQLETRVETNLGDPERARFPVEVKAGRDADEDPAAWLDLRHVCEEGARRGPKGAWTRSPLCAEKDPVVRLYPESGHLVGNLESRIWIWAPGVDGPVTVQPLSPRPAPGAPRPPPPGEPLVVVPGPLGLAGFEYLPTYPRGELSVRAGGKDAEILLRDLPSQILVGAREGLVLPDEHLNAEVRVLRSHVPLFVDTWAGGRWIGADSTWLEDGSGLAYEVKLPPGTKGFVALRAYVGLGAPGGAYGERVFYVSRRAGTGEGLRDLSRALKALPSATPLVADGAPSGPEPLPDAVLAAPPRDFAMMHDPDRARVGLALLSRVSSTAPASPLLGDSTEAKKAAIETFKARLRLPLLAGLVLLGSGVFLGAGWLVVQNRRAVRRRLAELELDEPVEPAEGEAPPPRVSAAGLLVPGLALLLVLAAAGVGLLILLQTLRWDAGIQM